MRLTVRECARIALIVFGSEADPLYVSFMQLIKREAERVPLAQRPAQEAQLPLSSSKPPPSIETNHFFHLAISECVAPRAIHWERAARLAHARTRIGRYHEVRPPSDAANPNPRQPGSAPGLDGWSLGDVPQEAIDTGLVRDAEDLERLFVDAHGMCVECWG